MSARDDYETLANFRGASQTGEEPYEIMRVLNEVDSLRAELDAYRALGTHEEVARAVAMVKGEQERDADQAELELFDLARLALEGNARDVEMFVHRLAYRHRGRAIGQALKSIDKVPAVSLRAAGDVGAAAPLVMKGKLTGDLYVSDDVIEGDSDAVKTRQAEDDAYLASGPWPDRMRYPAADTGETP